jgi:hypothetical protein
MAFQVGAFQADAFQGADGKNRLVLDAVFASAFTAAITGTVSVKGTLDGDVQIAFAADVSGSVLVTGALDALFSPLFTAAFEGDSDGTIIIIPRDIAGGIAYLIEIEAHDPVLGETVTLRYSSDGFNTTPIDVSPNAFYAPRIKVPGNYERSMFGSGMTTGEQRVGAGVVELINADGALSDGGRDSIYDHAFDGYDLTIRTVSRIKPRYENSVVVFRGTMEQAEFPWQKVVIRMRDRLAVLNEPIQPVLFAGTTIAGGMDEAEGRPDDLKGRPKPLCFGVPRNVPAVHSNIYDDIFDLGQLGLDGIAEVRDSGVLIPATGTDYTTVAALRAASIPEGKYATVLNLGLFRLGSIPEGTITASPIVGATAADRSAGQLARRILLHMDLVEGTDFLAKDVEALDTVNDAELGYWIGTDEETALSVLSKILGSIGATIVPDRLGVFRMYRFDDPAGIIPVTTFTAAEVLETATVGIERLVTGDQGRGVPAWRITQHYGHNAAVMNKSELDVSTTDEFKGFAVEEWRNAVADDYTILAVHRLAPELTFDSYFVHEADAQAEAERRLSLYGVVRDYFVVPVKSYLVEQVDLNSVVRLTLPRFGLDSGKLFRVVGIVEDFETGITKLELWG